MRGNLRMSRRNLIGIFTLLVFAVAIPAIAADEKSNSTPSSTATPEAATPATAATKPDVATPAATADATPPPREHEPREDYSSLIFVFMLSTFIGLGVILRVSRLLHTPLMSLTNAISAIAVVGSIIVTGTESNPVPIRMLGAVALFASMTNIVSGFLITDRMLKMFKTPGAGGKR
jgi:H+-translocating NAD(P) transhydrogenase subunit alpha